MKVIAKHIHEILQKLKKFHETLFHKKTLLKKVQSKTLLKKVQSKTLFLKKCSQKIYINLD